jgi:c-di-GMP-related signal transduction protein
MSFADQIIQHADKLPTLPTAVMKLSQLIADQQSSAGDFEKVIKPDPALTANLLRIANSAFFSARIEITSVRQSNTPRAQARLRTGHQCRFRQGHPRIPARLRIKSNSFCVTAWP